MASAAPTIAPNTARGLHGGLAAWGAGCRPRLPLRFTVNRPALGSSCAAAPAAEAGREALNAPRLNPAGVSCARLPLPSAATPLC